MKKFRAWHSFLSIEEFEVVKETDKQVTFIRDNGKEYKESRSSAYTSWHDSKEDAKLEVIRRIKFDINKLDSQIKYQKERIKEVEAL
jgi:hypothetical protein